MMMKIYYNVFFFLVLAIPAVVNAAEIEGFGTPRAWVAKIDNGRPLKKIKDFDVGPKDPSKVIYDLEYWNKIMGRRTVDADSDGRERPADLTPAVWLAMVACFTAGSAQKILAAFAAIYFLMHGFWDNNGTTWYRKHLGLSWKLPFWTMQVMDLTVATLCFSLPYLFPQDFCRGMTTFLFCTFGIRKFAEVVGRPDIGIICNCLFALRFMLGPVGLGEKIFEVWLDKKN